MSRYEEIRSRSAEQLAKISARQDAIAIVGAAIREFKYRGLADVPTFITLLHIQNHVIESRQFQ